VSDIIGLLGGKETGIMSAWNSITAKDLARDMCSGMTDFELTEKYKLTPEEFHLALNVLIELGFVTRQQLEERQQLSDSQIIRAFVDAEIEKP
jgi:CheY-specific phosphatase CheX